MNIIDRKHQMYLEQIDDIIKVNEARAAYKSRKIEEQRTKLKELDEMIAKERKKIRILQINVAKILLQQNTSITEIIEQTNLTEEQINAL